MSAPKRIQRKRTKGWRMPEGAVYVGRPSKWGNDFTVDGGDRQRAVNYFVDMLWRAPLQQDGRTALQMIREDLAGKDLACYCPLDQPCHADVLLEIANGGVA